MSLKKGNNAKQSNLEKLLKKRAGSLRKPTLLMGALGYALMVVVVIIGAHDHVYDGFGPVVPWVVGALFVLMSLVRTYEFVCSMLNYRSVKSYLEARDAMKRGAK